MTLQVESPKNIIIRMPNWLGDLVMATPILSDVRRRWPESKITVMCQSNVAALLKEDSDIDEVFSFSRPSGWLRRQEERRLIEFLRRGKYDLGILLTNSFSSAWRFWRGNVRNRVGYSENLRSLFLNKALPWPREKERQHLVVTYKELLPPLGIALSDTPPRLHVTAQELQNARQILKKHGTPENGIIIGINPGAAYGSAKCWLPERFQEVTHRLLANPLITVVYFGDSTGTPLVNQICSGMPLRVINLAGATSLRELIALIKTCDILLTNDSGPMHIASAVGTKLLALFGSTNDVSTGPYSGGKVIHKHVDCSPCYLRKCPIDFRCMTRIEVDEVYNELQSLIS